MAACIRRNRSLLKWLALVLTMSSVLVWFGVTVGISPRDKSASASKGIERTRYSETQREVTSVFSQLAYNVNERDPETASRVLKSMETPNNTAPARTAPVSPSMKVHQDNHLVTQQETNQ